MKKLLVWIVGGAILAGQGVYSQPVSPKVPDKEIGIRFHRNIELLGLAFFIGTMAPQYEHDTSRMSNGVPRKEWFAYDLALYKKYRSFATHPDLLTVARFGEQHEGSVLGTLLFHLAEFPRAVIHPEKDAPYLRPFINRQDSVASLQAVLRFVDAANRLYKAMDFDQYFRDHARQYDQARAEIRSVLPAPRLVAAMEKFYRQSFAEYSLLPSLTIPSGMAFGVNYTAGGKAIIMNLFGPFAVQQFADTARLRMGFADEDHIRELSTHEFGHSFSNPVVAKIPPALVQATAPLYEPVREAMDNQGYNTWQSCIYEYFVRAGEVVIARKLGHAASAQKLLQWYTGGRQFMHLPLVIAELEKYDRDPAMTYRQAVLNTMEKLKALVPAAPAK